MLRYDAPTLAAAAAPPPLRAPPLGRAPPLFPLPSAFPPPGTPLALGGRPGTPPALPRAWPCACPGIRIFGPLGVITVLGSELSSVPWALAVEGAWNPESAFTA